MQSNVQLACQACFQGKTQECENSWGVEVLMEGIRLIVISRRCLEVTWKNQPQPQLLSQPQPKPQSLLRPQPKL